MKTPIVYYGGKTNMLKHILPLIPGDHRTYVEPFFGGGAVFFGKEPSEVEVINDKIDLAVNFYLVAQNEFEALQKMIRATLHSETDYKLSKSIVKGEIQEMDPVRLAWAFWVQTALTFGHQISGGFAFANAPIAHTTARRVDAFTEQLSKRLRHAQIFNRDALDVIKRFDHKDTFFYLDPPYANSDCGHYKEGKDVFYDLISLLPSLKGRWLLSSYPCPEVEALRMMPGVEYQDIDKNLAIAGKHNAGKRKTECLTWNYSE